MTSRGAGVEERNGGKREEQGGEDLEPDDLIELGAVFHNEIAV